MRRTGARRFFLLLVPALLVLGAACDRGMRGIGPENQLEVTNAADQFQFQLTALDGVTDTRSYAWQNTGSQATIDVSPAVAGGSAMLTIKDAEGKVMYQTDIAQDSDATTPQGTPGTWRIEVYLNQTSGTFNFRVQKKT